MNYEKIGEAIKSELDGLAEKHQGFTEQLTRITSNLRGLERQKVGLVYKSKVEGNQAATDQLNALKTDIIEQEQDAAELQMVCEQLSTRIDDLGIRYAAATRNQHIVELKESAKTRLEIASELETAMDAVIGVVDRYISLGNNMTGAGSRIGFPWGQWNTQNRAVSYLNHRLSEHFPRNYHVPSRERRSIVSIDTELMDGAFSNREELQIRSS